MLTPDSLLNERYRIVHPIGQGGSYTLLVGSDNDPASGAYAIRIDPVP